ncbi:MAG: hypothetical protein ACYC2G_08895 [Gemmatimonadaceae bacterium]
MRAADGVSPSDDEPPPSRVGTRIAAFIVVLVVVLVMVTVTDDDHAHVARHFLSNLLRHLF